MEKVIEKGMVYGGKYLRSLACLALEDAYDLDDFISCFDLKRGRITNEYAHQLEKMQWDYAREYLFCEMTQKYPDWEEKVECRQSGNDEDFILKFNTFKIILNGFNGTKRGKDMLQCYLMDLDQSFLKRLDDMLYQYSNVYALEDIQSLRKDHIVARDYLYEKAVLNI